MRGKSLIAISLAGLVMLAATASEANARPPRWAGVCVRPSVPPFALTSYNHAAYQNFLTITAYQNALRLAQYQNALRQQYLLQQATALQYGLYQPYVSGYGRYGVGGGGCPVPDTSGGGE